MQRVLVVLIWLATLSSGVAQRHQLEVESTYLGDGWFKYRLASLDDPYFTQIGIGAFWVLFTNVAELGPIPEGWTFTDTTDWVNWGCTNAPYAMEAMPYEGVFLIRSTERSYSRRQYAMVIMTISAQNWSGSGFARFDCLSPCSPEEADGSATNLLSTISVTDLPEVQILGLTRTNSVTYGVTFSYNGPSTMLLEGSFDLKQWNQITYILVNGAETSWTTNQPLDSNGNFFRLKLIAETHLTNLPPLNVLSSAKAFESQGSKIK